MDLPGRRFGRADRLRKSGEFRRVSTLGKRRAGTYVIVLRAAQTGLDQNNPRLGLTVSRKVGGAVVRNRVKRRLRHWFQINQSEIPRGVDLVLIARNGAGRASYSTLAAELARLIPLGPSDA